MTMATREDAHAYLSEKLKEEHRRLLGELERLAKELADITPDGTPMDRRVADVAERIARIKRDVEAP